jgi:hypothetical protein
VIGDVSWCLLSVGWLTLKSSCSVWSRDLFLLFIVFIADTTQRKEEVLQSSSVWWWVTPVGERTRMRPYLLMSASVSVFCRFSFTSVHLLPQRLFLLARTHRTQTNLPSIPWKLYQVTGNTVPYFYSKTKKKLNKLRGLSPQANYTDRTTPAYRRSLCFTQQWQIL